VYKKVFITFLVLVSGISVSLYAQKDSVHAQKDTLKSIKLPAVVEHGDTIAVYTLKDTRISPPPDPDLAEKQKEWEHLRKNVCGLMSYANIVVYKMHEIDARMNAMDKKKDRKKYLRAEREQLAKDYGAKLKDLSVYQAKILIKLIYRQTGKTSYDLIKEYESGFTAGFWQTLSKLDAMDLKDTYDPNKDTLIETAIKVCGY